MELRIKDATQITGAHFEPYLCGHQNVWEQEVAGDRWRAVGVSEEQQGRQVKLSEHRIVILILCSATKHRLLAVKNQFSLIVSLCSLPLL
jgi:hypothetical protein